MFHKQFFIDSPCFATHLGLLIGDLLDNLDGPSLETNDGSDWPNDVERLLGTNDGSVVLMVLTFYLRMVMSYHE